MKNHITQDYSWLPHDIIGKICENLEFFTLNWPLNIKKCVLRVISSVYVVTTCVLCMNNAFIMQRKNIPTPRIQLTYNIKEFQKWNGGHFENGRHFFFTGKIWDVPIAKNHHKGIIYLCTKFQGVILFLWTNPHVKYPVCLSECWESQHSIEFYLLRLLIIRY